MFSTKDTMARVQTAATVAGKAQIQALAASTLHLLAGGDAKDARSVFKNAGISWGSKIVTMADRLKPRLANVLPAGTEMTATEAEKVLIGTISQLVKEAGSVNDLYKALQGKAPAAKEEKSAQDEKGEELPGNTAETAEIDRLTMFKALIAQMNEDELSGAAVVLNDMLKEVRARKALEKVAA